MAHASPVDQLLRRARAHGFEAALRNFIDPKIKSAARLRAMQAALAGPAAPLVRQELGAWIVELLGGLVPEAYAPWRVLVQDSMLYVNLHLSAPRLAPKLVEQIELPARIPPERRLMLLIAKVPGLQKLGQVLARNRDLAPSLRRALAELENGILDTTRQEREAIIFGSLRDKLAEFSVEVDSELLCEASVSAVVPFRWRNPESRRRERGVFKVLKPYIREYYAEDMELLQGLAEFLRRNHAKYGVAARGLSDTFRQVRRLLQHEVDFRGEQETLARAYHLYGMTPGVRVPHVIQPLCTDDITALSYEHGVRITDAARRASPPERRRMAKQLVEAVIANPLFTPAAEALFHADPHAGNLLYNRRTGELTLLDWALTNSLTLAQRRHLTLLFLMVFLRDPVGIFLEVQALSLHPARRGGRRERALRKSIARFIEELPLAHAPDSMDAMRLLQRLAFGGVRLPASLILLRKIMFTLDGILYDIVGSEVALDSILLRNLLRRWLTSWKALGSPLSLIDWLQVQTSAALCGTRWSLQLAQKMLKQPRRDGKPGGAAAQSQRRAQRSAAHTIAVA